MIIMRKSSIFLGIFLALLACYVGYSVIILFPLLATTEALILNIFLLTTEVLAALFSIYLYFSILSTMEWKSPEGNKLTKTPFVTIQVPIFNENFKDVKKTLEGALNQDYPKNKYEIIVADDSTEERLARQLRKFCQKKGIKYVYRNNRKGFKAGALNNILPMSRGEIIAILDADDIPEPSFISHSVPVLMEEKVAFVQTRNAERNHDFNTVTGIGRLVRDLFFGSIMKSKDLRKLAIFCGSGGLIKKKAINEAGGFPEDTVTEDIDLSTILFSKGYTSKYINPAKCHGLLPSTFTGLCGQTNRWAYGTTKTLILRWKQILKIPGFWRKIEHFLSCMTYVLGPALVAIDIIMITHLLFKIPIFHMYEAKTVWIFGAMLTLSSFFALLFVQLKDNKVSMKRTLDYIFAIYGLSVNFTMAVFKALFNRKAIFFRTPRNAKKDKSALSLLRRHWIELTLGSLSIFAALLRITDPTYVSQSIWLIFFGIGFLTAPYFAMRYG